MRNRGMAKGGNKVSFGEFGLKAVSRGRITARQIEAARRAITRSVKRGGKVSAKNRPGTHFASLPPSCPLGQPLLTGHYSNERGRIKKKEKRRIEKNAA